MASSKPTSKIRDSSSNNKDLAKKATYSEDMSHIIHYCKLRGIKLEDYLGTSEVDDK
jgi:hypothetical protein